MTHTSDLPRCYGHNWAPGDSECEDCDLEIDCRDVVRRHNSPSPGRRVLVRSKPRASSRDAERNVQIMGGSLDVQSAPRLRGEKWWGRLLKNFGLGAASRGGVELSLFCEDERMKPLLTPSESDDDDDDE